MGKSHYTVMKFQGGMSDLFLIGFLATNEMLYVDVQTRLLASNNDYVQINYNKYSKIF